MINIFPSFSAYIITLLIAIIVLFFKSYIQEKAKIKALQSENRNLISETEKIKSCFNIELENLKKEHQLDISKRRYQYESKKETYLKFFQLLDQFTRDNNVKNQDNILLILDEFNRNFLNANNQNNKKAETSAITVLSKKMQKLTFDASQDLMKIKHETNTIRLISSDEILRKLDILNLAYDNSMEVSNKMMRSMPTLMLTNNQAQMQADQKEIQLSAMVINSIKEEIIELMRIELNEI